MTVTPQLVQKLRETSGAGIMDCKRSLEQSNGDLEKAIQFLREKGKTSAVQKAGRFAGQGLVCSWISQNSREGGIIELNCESDFVARTEEFQDFAKKLTQTVIQNKVKSVEALMSLPFSGAHETVESVLKEKIGKLGENILIKRATCLGGGKETLIGTYIHAPFEKSLDCGSLGVLLELQCDKDSSEVKSLLKELCLQVAAASPKWIAKENVPADIVEKEIGIYKEQCKQSGKPEKAWDKIIDGKLKDFYKMFCLLEQTYVREPSGKSFVHSLISSISEKVGSPLTVRNFVRFKVGE